MKGAALVLVAAAIVACDAPPGQDASAYGAPTMAIPASEVVVGHGADDGLYRVAGGVLLDDGFALGEEASGSISFYNWSGERRAVTGRMGEGPGEFRRLFWLQRAGTRLFAYDWDLQRLSVYSLEGQLVESVSLSGVGEHFPADPVGAFADGTILLRAAARDQPAASGPTGSNFGVHRPKAVLLRLHAGDNVQIDSVAAYVETESYTEPFGRGGSLQMPLAFGRQTGIAVQGQAFFLMTNDDHTIEQFRADGSSLIKLGSAAIAPRTPVTEEDVRAARAATTERRRETFDRMPRPALTPPYGWGGAWPLQPLHVSREGEVWALLYGGIRDRHPRWAVFSSSGDLIGVYRAEHEMRILDIADGRVLTLERDSMGVETVHVKVLTRPSGS